MTAQNLRLEKQADPSLADLNNTSQNQPTQNLIKHIPNYSDISINDKTTEIIPKSHKFNIKEELNNNFWGLKLFYCVSPFRRIHSDWEKFTTWTSQHQLYSEAAVKFAHFDAAAVQVVVGPVEMFVDPVHSYTSRTLHDQSYDWLVHQVEHGSSVTNSGPVTSLSHKTLIIICFWSIC